MDHQSNFRKKSRDAGLRRSKLPKGVSWGIWGILALFVFGFIVSFFVARQRIQNSIAAQAGALHVGITDLQHLDPDSATAAFSSLGNTISGASGMLAQFGFLLHGGSGAIASFTDLSNQLAFLSGEVGAFQANLFGSSGSAASSTFSFASNITALRGTIDKIDSDTDELSADTAFLGGLSIVSGSDYVSLKTQLKEIKIFLDAFDPWVSAPVSHHLLVFFQNPSELRPTGGFWGSYADVTVFQGTITDISVHDIADVDKEFDSTIIPPQPLQLEVKRWAPANANWFFDFPTSASKTLSFFEASDLYGASSTSPSSSPETFDGVIAISPNVISDLLSITGPITIANPSTTFTSANLLVQLQRLVQLGETHYLGGDSATYPKQVLRDLGTALSERLASSTADQKQELFGMALDWFGKKDVMAYFPNPDFEHFTANYGADGGVYDLPQKFNGDYMALVDTNINGGKSDTYVSSTVRWVSRIGDDGVINDNLTINRKHNGNTSPYSWYRMTNQDYMQLFVPDGSSFVDESGGAAITITPKINYAKNNYSTDPLIASIEATDKTLFAYPAITTHEESGKEVFATWSVLKAGASGQVSINYTHHSFTAPADGLHYQFIFEKQAGTNRNYSFEIDAPFGYDFAENNLPTYEYQSNDPPGRLIMNLTLKKI